MKKTTKKFRVRRPLTAALVAILGFGLAAGCSASNGGREQDTGGDSALVGCLFKGSPVLIVACAAGSMLGSKLGNEQLAACDMVGQSQIDCCAKHPDEPLCKDQAAMSTSSSSGAGGSSSSSGSGGSGTGGSSNGGGSNGGGSSGGSGSQGGGDASGGAGQGGGSGYQDSNGQQDTNGYQDSSYQDSSYQDSSYQDSSYQDSSYQDSGGTQDYAARPPRGKARHHERTELRRVHRD